MIITILVFFDMFVPYMNFNYVVPGYIHWRWWWGLKNFESSITMTWWPFQFREWFHYKHKGVSEDILGGENYNPNSAYYDPLWVKDMDYFEMDLPTSNIPWWYVPWDTMDSGATRRNNIFTYYHSYGFSDVASAGGFGGRQGPFVRGCNSSVDSVDWAFLNRGVHHFELNNWPPQFDNVVSLHELMTVEAYFLNGWDNAHQSVILGEMRQIFKVDMLADPFYPFFEMYLQSTWPLQLFL